MALVSLPSADVELQCPGNQDIQCSEPAAEQAAVDPSQEAHSDSDPERDLGISEGEVPHVEAATLQVPTVPASTEPLGDSELFCKCQCPLCLSDFKPGDRIQHFNSQEFHRESV